MEEVGTQVASPLFIHNKTLVGRFCDPIPPAKKRSLPFQGSTSPPNQQQQQQEQHGFFSSFENLKGNWNPKQWEWDSSRFTAKLSERDTNRLGNILSGQLDESHRGRDEERNSNSPAILSVSRKTNAEGEEDESLLLKLGGGGVGLIPTGKLMTRPNKRVRSGSPGSGGGGNYPVCQVDNCKEDLSSAKDYHRRHKVCEIHSKASKALVGKQMQRFCQQCSRFHPLLEFDEGKRSCRRRLAGHNRRRRKSQPEDITPQVALPVNCNINGNGDMDIVNWLTVLARGQGNPEDASNSCSPLTNKDKLIQILDKINSLPLPAELAAKLPISDSLNRDVAIKMYSKDQNASGNACSSTLDLLATLAAPPPDGLEILSHRSSQGSDTKKSDAACLGQAAFLNLHNGPVVDIPSAKGEKHDASLQSPIEKSNIPVRESTANLPLQLFSSSPTNDSPPKLALSRKYFSSDSSNPIEERSPSFSPPIMQRLFLTEVSRVVVKADSLSTTGEVTPHIKGSKSSNCGMSLDLFGGANPGADAQSIQSSPYRVGYTSSSGSDQSPSSLNSDAQDRTGRVLFKLFDKDPSHLPGSLRTQIYNWLSRSPTDMEGYIRPGCVVLSIYISMPFSAWEKLEGNFLDYVNSLVHDGSTDFWRSLRFQAHTGRNLVSHRVGMLHACKMTKAWGSPQLMSISPLAVVDGKETCLLLRGRNLRTSSTKIYCTHTGCYAIKNVSGPASQETSFDEVRMESFKVNAPGALGRCFIEVENGFRGNSFPVIIADASICEELRYLEFEFNEGAAGSDSVSADHSRDTRLSSSKEEVLHFLNELGWLFQRKGIIATLEAPGYGLSRLRFLFTFAVERDFCALVKTLLDILLETSSGTSDVSEELLEMLSQINLLLRAVKRRCKKMVELLTHYSIRSFNSPSRKFIFPPDLFGPGGNTPLHLAASTSSSDDMVDALTDDPQEIGLQCWNSLLDASGLSPYAYALMKNNDSYNTLVARKLAQRKHSQVYISISDELELRNLALSQEKQPGLLLKPGNSSCSRCAVVAKRYQRRIPTSQGLLNRPFMHSMLVIAAVCVCVCVFIRGSPHIGLVPFEWKKLPFGSI